MASQGASTDSRFKREKLWLELSDGDENWHECWLGHGRRLEGLGFGIECAHRAQSRAKRAQRALRAPLPCFLPYTAVKIGMNIQWGIVDGWRVLVLGSCVRITAIAKVVARIVGGGRKLAWTMTWTCPTAGGSYIVSGSLVRIARNCT